MPGLKMDQFLKEKKN